MYNWQLAMYNYQWKTSKDQSATEVHRETQNGIPCKRQKQTDHRRKRWKNTETETTNYEPRTMNCVNYELPTMNYELLNMKVLDKLLSDC
jgi:membrane-associated HD superfamily phosphohydrolase